MPRGVVATMVAGALLVGTPLSAALAAPTPTPPSDDDVRKAQAAVTAAAGDVAAMEVRLAQLSAVADDAEVAVERAGEAYSQALADAQAAQQAADTAASRSQQADTAAETARQSLMAYARQMAHSGGSMDTLEAVLSANGFQDVAERTADLSRLTGKADDTVQNYRAAQLVAQTLHSRADAAAQVAAGKQGEAQAALATAQQVQSDTQAQVDAAAAERDTLIDQLAQARQTSADVERARQDEIDRENKQRQEDAAKAARLAPAGGTTGGTPSGGTPAGGAPSGGGNPSGGAPSSGATPPAGGTGTGDSGTGTSGGTGGSGSSGGAYGLGTGRSQGSAQQGLTALAWAEAQLGKEYVWGAAGPDSFDCSGLTMRAWQNAGVTINRTSRDQYKQVLKISYDDLRPGDLVFWTDDPNDPSQIYHVAMWAGDGKIVEASKPGVPLRLTTMRWSGTMPYAGRP